MKISKDGAVQPPKFTDVLLNKNLGRMIGGLSDADVQVIAIRYAEIQLATRIRQRWLTHLGDVAESTTENARVVKIVSTDPAFASVRDEVVGYVDGDQQRVDQEYLLARAHIILCERVIGVLTTSLTGQPPTSTYAAEAADRTPLRHLQDSLAAIGRAGRRLGKANGAWELAMDVFESEAGARNSFARGAGSVTLAAIDALAGDTFEKQVAWLLERDGCTILQRHGGPNDKGADVIAATPDGRRIVLQCKHSIKPRNRVDPQHVHQLNGTARPEHGADIAGIVTNRTLSEEAERFAVRHGIHVIDRRVLQSWATYGASWLPARGGSPAVA